MMLRLIALVLLLASAAQAQTLERVQSAFEYGKFAEALAQADALLAQPGGSEVAQADLHQWAGLSAFNLGKVEEARRHFASVLRLFPDRSLDPFSVPPPAIAAFEAVRKEMESSLAAIRYEQGLRAERLKKEAAEAEAKSRAEASAHPALVPQQTRPEPPLWVNFLPFGAGQFQQGRTGWGWGLAIGEGALAAASVAGYIGFQSLYEEQRVTLQDVQTSTGTAEVVERGIPSSKRGTAQTLKWLQISAGAGFWATYAFGVVEALLRRRALSSSVEVQPTSAASERVIPPEAPRSGLAQLRPDLSFSPLPGGGAAGLSFDF